MFFVFYNIQYIYEFIDQYLQHLLDIFNGQKRWFHWKGLDNAPMWASDACTVPWVGPQPRPAPIGQRLNRIGGVDSWTGCYQISSMACSVACCHPAGLYVPIRPQRRNTPITQESRQPGKREELLSVAQRSKSLKKNLKLTVLLLIPHYCLHRILHFSEYYKNY